MLWEQKCYNLCHEYFLKYKKENIPIEWVAGLISVECASLNPRVYRKEPHVIDELKWVKSGKMSSKFPGFNASPIKDYIMKYRSNDAFFESMGASFGLFQIMGYHFINKFHLPPEKYIAMTIEDSIKYGMEFMESGMKFIKYPNIVKNGVEIPPFDQYLRWHNTGSTTGKTYSPDYCKNANNMAKRYKQLMEDTHGK